MIRIHHAPGTRSIRPIWLCHELGLPVEVHTIDFSAAWRATPEWRAISPAGKVPALEDDGVRVVHRMGDLGWFDEQGRLWFCGRKSQRVETVEGARYTEQVEPIFNADPRIRRSALVGVGAPGRAKPVLCIELAEPVRGAARRALFADLRRKADRFEHTRNLRAFLLHPGFPVDIRHNAKIGREKLAQWASKRLRA